jgi:alpha-beta hydrolase superfamily lysophospholipase
MRKSWIIAGVVVLVGGLAVAMWPRAADIGRTRFFADQTYNFEALRVLSEIAEAGGDYNEAMQAIAGIRAGDAQGWFNAWKAAGDRASALAARTNDPVSKGDADLRAHTYYRSAEFFLRPDDPRRQTVWTRNINSFELGLKALGVAHERFAVPYGQHHLSAIYYPGPAGAEKRPLLVAVGGFDSTMEELYLLIAGGALRRGYSVLTYEGPGQGSVLREQGLTFQPDWEKPNGAVLDAFLAAHARPARIVLIGVSLGGYLAPRAAAFDQRIDGVVSYDVFYDGYAAATAKFPSAVLGMMFGDPGLAWAIQNGEWVFGVDNPEGVTEALSHYRLASVAPRIGADVLILAGDDDQFVPSAQADAFAKSLVNARSVTTVKFDRASGAAEHCQMGAPSIWQGALFDWLAAKFPSA